MRPLHSLLTYLLPLRGWVALSVLLGCLTVISNIALLGTSAWLIATAALQPSIAALQVAIVGVRFFGISRAVARYLERLVTHQVTFRVLAEVRVRFYAAIEPLSPLRLLGYRSGDLLSRATADIATLENFYVRAVAPPLVALLIVVGMTLFVLGYEARLALALLAFLLLTGVVLPVLSQRASRGPGRELAAARAALDAEAVDTVQGAADLVAFGAGGSQGERLNGLSRDLGRVQARLTAINAANTAGGTLLTWLAVVALLTLAAPLVAAGRLSGVDVAVLALVTLAAFEAVLPLPAAAHHLEASLEAARRLFAVGQAALHPSTGDDSRGGVSRVPIAAARDTEPPEQSGEVSRIPIAAARNAERPERSGGSVSATESKDAELSRARAPRVSPVHGASHGSPVHLWPGGSGERHTPPTAGSPPAIAIHHLTARYAPDEPPALVDVSLDVPAGGRVAIVGPSGAGKTTLVNVLLRFLDVEAGEVRLAGRELRDLTPEAVREQIGVVAQQTYLFNTTIRENLRLARPAASPSELEDAARAAQLHDFILSLPQGYDTWIGEQGWQLSGGERQRLAIARALLKDAPVLLLDEPAANLDRATEAALLAALAPLMAGRTTLTITHRLAGLTQMDAIIVLDRGRVAEQGTEAELLARGGLYRRLWERQHAILSAPRPML